MSASASAHKGLFNFRYRALFHKNEYRLVFPNFPPADFSAKDSAKLVLTFEKKFELTQLNLAWNGKHFFSNASLRRNAKWVSESPAGAVLEIDLNFLFESEKQVFHRYVRDCLKRNGRFEIWWRAPVRLVKGELVWGRGDAVTVMPVPPRVVIDQVAPADRINPGGTLALRFHATPLADGFECSVDGKAFAACQSPLFVESLKRGMHSVSLRAKIQNVVGQTLRYDFYAVGAAPKLVLQKVEPPSFINGGDSLTFTFVDKAIGESKLLSMLRRSKVRTISCQLDNDKPFDCKSPVVFKGLVEGGHIVTIQATKPELLEAPIVYAFLVERSVPVLSVTATPAELSNEASAQFSFVSDRPATFRCALDGKTDVCASPWKFQLEEGDHTAVISAVDELGRSSLPYSFHFRTDFTAPQFSVAPDPSAPLLNQGKLNVAYSANEPIRDVACELDGQALVACGSPLVLAGLTDGNHRVVVSAFDLAGNEGQFAYDFAVDSLSPAVQVQRVAPLASPSNESSASFTFSASEQSQFFCSLDGAVASSCVSPVSFESLNEGPHELVVQAQDAAGNSSQASSAWEVDLSAPAVVLGEAIPAEAVTESQSLTLNVQSEASASLFYQLDAGPEAAFASPLMVNDLIEGQHRLQIRARDLSGNVSQAQVYQWTVAMAATVSLVSVANPGPTTAVQSNAFEFEGSHATEFRCALDGAPFVACVSPFQVAGLSDGDHVFSVKGVNLAGQEGAAISFAWRVEAPPAVVSLSGSVSDGATSPSRSESFSFSSNGTDFQCALDAAAFAPCASPFQAGGLNDGAHSFKVFARNVRGLAGETAQINWTVLTPAAVITIGAAVPPQAVTASGSLSLSFSAANASQVSCSLDGQAALPCTSPVAYSGLGHGPHSLSIGGVSAGGTAGVNAVYAWSVDMQAPVVTIDSTTPSTSPTAIVFLMVNFHADDANAAFLCGLDGAAPQPCSSPWTASVTTDGPHAVAIWGVDAVGNQSVVPATYNWTVDRSFSCTNFSVTQVTSTQVSVSWRTNAPSSSTVRYGFGNNRNGTVVGAANVTQHTVLVSNLLTNTFYSAQALSQTVDGRNCQTSPIFFTTPP